MTSPRLSAFPGVVERAYAKVNLHLAVGDVRADGYHDLDTVFHSLSLHDTIRLEAALMGQQPAPGSKAVAELTLTGPSSAILPTDHNNLAWAAAEAFAQALKDTTGATLPSVRIHITKGIPVAGGMAGGSADAAGVLRGLNRALSYPLPHETIMELALDLGSDVPFCVLEGTAHATGRGENLTPLSQPGTLHFALAFHRRGLSTPRVFHTLDEIRARGHHTRRAGTAETLQTALATGQATTIAAAIDNDLQAPALTLNPALGQTLQVGEESGALVGFISGSGPTCAFLCADENTARHVADCLAAAHVADDVAYAASQGPAITAPGGPNPREMP